MLVFCFFSATAVSQSSLVYSLDEDIIRYQAPPNADPIAQLQRQIDSGESPLHYREKGGYLCSVLELLNIPASSQVLVFSRTSFQQHLISPASPRALYFNDTVYVGWVRGSDMLEISSVDPERGAMFYTLGQTNSPRPKFVRREECLQCHDSPRTSGVPGHLMRSVFPDREGFPLLQAGSFSTDQASPLKERWGGWYVTGSHGTQRHMGNIWALDKSRPDELDLESGANLTSLKPRVDLSDYLKPDSDLVALMVLAHQLKMHNLITHLSWETRIALSQQDGINQALGRPSGELSGSTTRRIQSAADALLSYMLFADEAQLGAPIKGTSGFEMEFSLRGRRDRKGRSLRDFDLRTRLFRYPCSFLVYSEAFDALPTPALDYVWRRMWEVLNGKTSDKEFLRLSSQDRQAILQILLDTKPNLPSYWRETATEIPAG